MTEAHEGMTDPRLQAEGELSLARLALDEGDLPHAADHVGNALVCDPSLPEVYELLARVANHPDGGVELFALRQPVYLGTVVARAHVLAASGDHAEALDLLISAQCHAPDGSWADVPWVRDPDLPSRVSALDVANAMRRLFAVMSDPVATERRRPLLPYLELVRNAASHHAGDAGLLWTASIFLRRMGDLDKAVEFALRSERAEPSFHAAMALGYAYRNLKRWDDAERAWLRALRFDPGNLALHTDIGELLALAGRPDEGLAWVELALEQDPHNASAFPTACGMRFAVDGDIAHLVALADLLRETPGNAHADAVLTQHSQRRYWLGHIPVPSEAVINVLNQVLETGNPEAGSGELTVSAPEPPSALHAFGQVLPAFEVTVTDVPEPDARTPIRPVDRRIWRYEGTRVVPAVPPPSAGASRALQQAAAAGWRHLPAAYDEAVRLSGLALDDLLGALAHPPAPASGAAADWPMWIKSVQAWACLAIAHHRSDQPWPESVRRSVLLDLAYGPEDWSTEAALLALVTTAWVSPETRADVAEHVGRRFMAAARASKTRAVTILEPMAYLVRATPGMHPDVRALADRVIAPASDEQQPRKRRFFKRRR